MGETISTEERLEIAEQVKEILWAIKYYDGQLNDIELHVQGKTESSKLFPHLRTKNLHRKDILTRSRARLEKRLQNKLELLK